MTFWIDSVKDNGGMKYWVLFTHGNFHAPTAVIGDHEMTAIAQKVLGINEKITDLGAEIVGYRKANKITQAEFALTCGVSRNYISQIENGKADNLSLDVYQRITKALQP